MGSKRKGLNRRTECSDDVGVGEAGESARAEVERVRRQLADTLAEADRLAKRIDGFEAGEKGERTTAKALTALPADFAVHHDLHIVGSDANVDHVVVGPTGVYVIDSKHWAGRVNIGRGTLWSGRHPQRRALTNLAWETACVAAALASTGARAPVPVISVTGSGRGDRAFEIGGTWVLPVEMLTNFLAAGPSRVPAGVALAASAALSAAPLPRARYPSGSRTGLTRRQADHASERLDPISVLLAPSPLERQESRPRLSRPGPSGSHPTRGQVPWTYPTLRPRTFPRSSSSSGTPRSQRLRAEQKKRAAQLAIGVLVIAVAGSVLRHLPQASTHPTAVAPARSSGGTSPADPQLRVAWSCPTPAAGWTAAFTLGRSEQATHGTWELQVSASERGPWTMEATGEGDMRLTGLQPDRSFWLRGGNLPSMLVAGNPTIEGRLTTPAGC